MEIKEKIKANLVRNIKVACADQGLTITELEKAAGLADNSIYKWQTTMPGIDKVKKVAFVLQIPVDELIGS